MVLTTLAIAFSFQQLTGGAQMAEPRPEKPLFALGGSDGRFEKHQITLIQNESDWISWWGKHGLRQERAGGSMPPAIDFERMTVIAVASGPGINSEGIVFPELVVGQGTAIVRYRESSFQTASFGNRDSSVPCNSWGVVAFFKLQPNQLFPEPRIVVEQNMQNLIGGPPVWKKRAEFELTKSKNDGQGLN